METSGKHIERAVRRGFIRLLRLMPRRRGPSHPLAEDLAPRILLLRHDRIGDAVVSTPIISLLRDRFPAARIDMLLGTKNRSAAEILPGLDEIFILPTSAGGVLSVLRELRRQRYDAVINLLAKDSASGAVLSALAGARRRIGFEGSTSGVYDVAIAHPAEPVHMVRETSLLLAPFGIKPIGPEPANPHERLSIAIPPGAREWGESIVKGLPLVQGLPIVALNISGSQPKKYWGRGNFVELVRLLMVSGLQPVIASAPRDRAELEAIASESGAPAFPPSSSLAEFLAMLAHADLVVTPDTSIVHCAAALGKPTVMIVASVETESVWGPWGVGGRTLRGETIPSIPVAAVAEAVRSLASETVPAFISSSAS